MEYFHPDQTELTGKKDSVVNFIPNNEIPCIICETSSITEDAFNKLDSISCNNDTQLLSATCQERNNAPPQTSTSDVIDKTISSISSPTTVPSENINNNLSTSLSMSKNTNSYIVCDTKQSYEAIVSYVKAPLIHQSPVINVNSLKVCKEAQKMLKNRELLSGASQESSDDPKKITSDVLDKTISSTSSACTIVPSQNINNNLSCTGIIKNTNSDITCDPKHSEEPTVSASIQSPVINVNSVKRLQGTREKKLLPINSCNPQYKNTPYIRNLPKNYRNVNYSNISSLRPFSYNKPRVNMMMQPSNLQPLLPTPRALLSTPVHKPLHSMNNNSRILLGVFSSSSEYRSAMRSYLESPVHMQPRMSQTAFPLFPNQGMQVQQNLNPINNRMKLLPNSTRCSSKPSLLPTPIFNYSKPQSKTNVSCFHNSNSFSSMNKTKSPLLETPPVQTSFLSLNEPFLPFHSKQLLENRPLSREEFNRYCYRLHLNEPEENFEEGDISQASKHDQRKRPLLETPVLTSSLNLNEPSQCNEKHSSLDHNLQVKELELKVKQEPIEEEESSVYDNAVPGTSASTSHSYECINHMEWPRNGPPRLTLPSSEYSLYNFDTQSPKKPRLSHCDVDVKPSIVQVDMNMQMPSVGQQQK